MLGWYREADHVREGRGLTGRLSVALDRVGALAIGGDADAPAARVCSERRRRWRARSFSSSLARAGRCRGSLLAFLDALLLDCVSGTTTATATGGGRRRGS